MRKPILLLLVVIAAVLTIAIPLLMNFDKIAYTARMEEWRIAYDAQHGGSVSYVSWEIANGWKINAAVLGMVGLWGVTLYAVAASIKRQWAYVLVLVAVIVMVCISGFLLAPTVRGEETPKDTVKILVRARLGLLTPRPTT